MFRRRYLKYSPEITLEIFTLVWNKLIEAGWQCSALNLSGEYNYFIRPDWGYLVNSNSGKWFAVSASYSKGHTEITVQEILGYDPWKATEEELLEEAKRRYPEELLKETGRLGLKSKEENIFLLRSLFQILYVEKFLQVFFLIFRLNIRKSTSQHL